ncbi:MAG TPA: hypothetical protein VEO95_02140 [Chthoniobacteraceae bacterium]|nr:hypothetical protein [Chthoniobacteraceae bacterium]
MLAASPITRQTVGRTFIVAISFLGTIAAAQLAVVVWAFIARSHVPLIATVGPVAPPVAAPFESATSVSPAPGETANFGVDPLKTTEPAKTAEIPKPDDTASPAEPAKTRDTTETAALTPPKPTPLPVKAPTLPEPEQSARFTETIDRGKRLREQGDMSTALIRFREAAAMDPKSPEAMFEIAVTLEKMQLPEKAAEQWRRMYEMGESAGPYYTTAEARLNQAKQSTMLQAAPNLAASTAEPEEGIAPGKTLGLIKVAAENQDDRTAAKHLTLRIPIKARAREKVDVRELTIQVLFYDIVDNQNLVQTTANVSSRWASAPADWLDSNIETLEVDYQLPLPDAKAARRENRKYFGYLIRVYYKGELQAATGEPERLVQQFPPEPRLSEDANKK